MKILFSSHLFPPSIGGLEEVGSILAHHFERHRHEVVVVTQTAGTSRFPFPFHVYSRPSPAVLLHLTKWCDLVFHNNISLQTAWPLLWFRKPWVVVHHTWIARSGGGLAFIDRLKLWTIRHAANIAVSKAVAASLSVPAEVIENPYRDDLFHVTRPVAGRPRDLIYLGRLVSDKGVDLLIEALAILQSRGARPSLSIVGSGPERPALEEQARQAGLGSQVVFTGARQGEDLAALLNEHRLLVVPSRWDEPFGIVALEALACGCVPVAARSGGLPEAVGPCGLLFAKDDARALAEVLRNALADEPRLDALRRHAPEHLAKHRAEAVAARYLAAIERAATAHRS